MLGARLTKLQKTHSGKYVKKMMEECSLRTTERKVGATLCEAVGGRRESVEKLAHTGLFEALNLIPTKF